MAVVNGYATVAELREHLGDTGSKLDTELLERSIEAASRAIDRHCGRRFWQEATTSARTYRPVDPLTVIVDDISTTTGLAIKTDTTGDGTWATTWDSADYQLEPLNADVVATGSTGDPYAWWRIVAIDDKTFITGTLRASLQVTARFGWSAVPDEVQEAAILKAVALFRRKDAPFGIAGIGDFGPVRISRRDPDVTELLAPYVRYARPEI
jgi:hypothetical protein